MPHRVRGARLVDRVVILVPILLGALVLPVHLPDVRDLTREVRLPGRDDIFFLSQIESALNYAYCAHVHTNGSYLGYLSGCVGIRQLQIKPKIT